MNDLELPLKLTVEGGELVMRIGLNTLKHSAEHCPLFYDYEVHGGSGGPYKRVVDTDELATDVIHQLTREKEDGSSPLSDLFDKAILAAYEDGSLGFYGDDD